jgi:hypothetical protein
VLLDAVRSVARTDDGGDDESVAGPVLRNAAALLLFLVVQLPLSLAVAGLVALAGVGWPALSGPLGSSFPAVVAYLAVGLPSYRLLIRGRAGRAVTAVVRRSLLFAVVVGGVQVASAIFVAVGEPGATPSFVGTPALLASVAVVGLGVPFVALTVRHFRRSSREQ